MKTPTLYLTRHYNNDHRGLSRGVSIGVYSIVIIGKGTEIVDESINHIIRSMLSILGTTNHFPRSPYGHMGYCNLDIEPHVGTAWSNL